MTGAPDPSPAEVGCRARISFDEAIEVLRRHADPLGVESVRLAKAGRRVLAEPVHARIDAPRYDASAMDGFAVVAGDWAAIDYRVVGTSYPGAPWAGSLGDGQAVRIMTGAAVPYGAGRVVPLEMADGADGIVRFPHGWPVRDHIRRRGSDIQCGDVVLSAGTMLDPRALLVAAAADVGTVRTWRRPVVSVIASGDELVAPGAAADIDGSVPDSLSEALLLMARQYDAKPGAGQRVPDDGNAIAAAAETLLQDCDVLVLAGGASRGDRDFAKASLGPLGLQIRFADVAMKPGKPVWYGRIGARHVLGLPGNPTAAMTTARLFLVPLLRALGGRTLDGALNWKPLPLTKAIEPSGPRESFLCGALAQDGIEVIERQSASAQLMLARADALVRIEPNAPAKMVGEMMQTLKF